MLSLSDLCSCPQRRQEKIAKYQGMNVYIKNLADDVDDAVLREEFSKVRRSALV